MMKKLFHSLFILTWLLMTSCFSSQTAQPYSSPEDQQDEAGEDVFKMADHQGEINLDPVYAYTAQDAQMFTAFSEGLVSYHPFFLSPLPGVARSWDISEDKKKYTFNLRENALYNNGDPVLAEDFRQSWLRLLSPEKEAEFSVYFDIIKGARAYRLGKNKDEAQVGIRALSKHKLEVELERPVSHFLKLLCHMSFAPVHPSYQEKDNWNNNTSLISNGPYNYFRTSAEEIVLTRNNLYWNRDKVDLPRIHILLSDDSEELSRLFKAGELHWATHFDTTVLEASPYIQYFPTFSLNFYFFKTETPPWDKQEVRRGLGLLLPWNKLRPDSPLFTADSIIPEIPGYEKQQGLSTDREEAMQLLAAAGYPEGKGLPPLTIKFGENPMDTEIALIMQETWKKELGLEVRFKKISQENYFAELKKNDYTLGTMVWIGDYADPLSMLQLWVSDSNLNEAHYKNSAFDDLIYKAIGEQDQEERYRLLAEAEKLILDEAVILPFSQHPSLNLLNDDMISGWFPNILDIHPFMYLRFNTDYIIPGLVQGNPELFNKFWQAPIAVDGLSG